ncbi:MAG: FAD-dependent oxidoreductase [Desulfatiglandaceae bacterium]
MTRKADPIQSTRAEDFDYMKVNVPCQDACPVLTNVPAYIRAVYENDFTLSYNINLESNLFPGVLGRICSRPCESKCRHGEKELGKPVNICYLKRAAADFRDRQVPRETLIHHRISKNVAIVGAGPSGLAAAHDLALSGLSVSVLEAMEKPGGMLYYGIPAFRLPRAVLTEEIERVLDLGIDFRPGIRLGKDITLAGLLKDFDAVLLATGCYHPRRLNIPGEAFDGVFSGLQFMMDLNSGRPPRVGKKVLVLGAGFTAFDCARSALRLGAEDVSICLRRTEEDLAVTREEVLEAKREGVRIESLMVAKTILGNGNLKRVEFIRTRPGLPGTAGKREITTIKGSEFVLDADTVIAATGQGPEPIPILDERTPEGIVTVEKGSFRSPVAGLFAAGDYVTGPSTVIQAIAAGRKAAAAIVTEMTGRDCRERVVRIEDTVTTDRPRTWDFLPTLEIPTLEPMQDRFDINPKEVELGYAEEQAQTESKRCYLCYLHYEIDIKRCIYCRYCIDVAPRDCIKLVKRMTTNENGAVTGFEETSVWRDVNGIIIDNSRCIRCGACMKICPVDCISVSKVQLLERPIGRAEEA